MAKRGTFRNPPSNEILKGRALTRSDRAKNQAAKNREEGQTEPRGKRPDPPRKTQ